jgi:hypothetical protein
MTVGIWKKDLEWLPQALWQPFEAFFPDVGMVKAARILLPSRAPWWRQEPKIPPTRSSSDPAMSVCIWNRLGMAAAGALKECF